MARSRKVSVNTKPIASHYASPNERIIEFTAPNGKGGLISLFYNEETGVVRVGVYRLDEGVHVDVSER